MLRRGSASEEEVGPSASLSAAAKAAAGAAPAPEPEPGGSGGAGGGGAVRGGQDTPTPGKRRPPHRHHHPHQRRSRLSPEGREREFPATRVGPQPPQQQQEGQQLPPPPPPHQQLFTGDTEGSFDEMGAGEERFFSHQGLAKSSNLIMFCVSTKHSFMKRLSLEWVLV